MILARYAEEGNRFVEGVDDTFANQFFRAPNGRISIPSSRLYA